MLLSFYSFLIIYGNVNATFTNDVSDEAAPERPEPQNFALLVAGGVRSKYFSHYAAEAGVLGAYDVLLGNKIPVKNMIIMSYDDAAQDTYNPCKGKVFKSPEWINVYDPSTIDYKNESVTPENVLNVLKGDSKAVVGGNGRVIQSTSLDRIFVFITGEGRSIPPAMNFQNHTSLWASDLAATLRWMKVNGRYAEMVIYLDTDFGGSILELIPKDINVYSISQTSVKFPPRGVLFCLLWHCNGVMPCLTMEFSYDWQEDVKNSDLANKTFHEHVESMKNLTVDYERGMGEYGDLSIGRKPLGCFMSNHMKYENKLEC